MTMPHPAGVDPALADTTLGKRIQHQRTRQHVRADIEDRLFLRVVDLENDVAVIECQPVGQTTSLNQLPNLFDTPEILRPHIAVDLQARSHTQSLSLLQCLFIKTDHLLIGDQLAVVPM